MQDSATPVRMTTSLAEHEKWMRRALDLAEEAEQSGEAPVGCVLVANGEVIGQGRNSPIALLDPTAHAEMLALRQAALAQRNYRLSDATLYCTLEPCVMCAGALVAARVGTLVFGARDLRFGGVRSKFEIADSPLLNHRVEVIEGVLGGASTALLKRFFEERRP
jgi:tRNA(adenine34) deaminase